MHVKTELIGRTLQNVCEKKKSGGGKNAGEKTMQNLGKKNWGQAPPGKFASNRT